MPTLLLLLALLSAPGPLDAALAALEAGDDTAALRHFAAAETGGRRALLEFTRKVCAIAPRLPDPRRTFARLRREGGEDLAFAAALAETRLGLEPEKALAGLPRPLLTPDRLFTVYTLLGASDLRSADEFSRLAGTRALPPALAAFMAAREIPEERTAEIRAALERARALDPGEPLIPWVMDRTGGVTGEASLPQTVPAACEPLPAAPRSAAFAEAERLLAAGRFAAAVRAFAALAAADPLAARANFGELEACERAGDAAGADRAADALLAATDRLETARKHDLARYRYRGAPTLEALAAAAYLRKGDLDGVRRMAYLRLAGFQAATDDETMTDLALLARRIPDRPRDRGRGERYLAAARLTPPETRYREIRRLLERDETLAGAFAALETARRKGWIR